MEHMRDPIVKCQVRCRIDIMLHRGILTGKIGKLETRIADKNYSRADYYGCQENWRYFDRGLY